MSTTEQHYNLFTWLNHIKHYHDSKKPTITIVAPPLSPPRVLQPADTAQAEESGHLKKDEFFSPPVATNSEDNSSFDDTQSKPSLSSSVFSRHFKDNLVHFHRPHGLLFQKFRHLHHHHTNQENSSTESAAPANSRHSSCSCCDGNSSSVYSQLQSHRQPSGSLNDADDERETEDDEDDESVRSKDWTKHPPCLYMLDNDTASSIKSSRDSSGNNKTSRENSVFALPGYIDSPDIGFKKLREDGDLVDYDDISVLAEEEMYQDNHSIQVQAHSRSVMHNELIRLALNGPFQSPLPTEQKKQVLHVGCGNGAWCVDMATLFPNWLVVGIDDKTGGPIQDQRKVPKNFKYVRCYYDLLRTLKDVPSDSFDLVFGRFLIFSYGEENYIELIRECERICKPGGYAEFYELDMRIYGNPKAGPMTHRLNAKVFKTMESHHLNPRMARKLGDMVSSVFNTHNQEPLDTDSSQSRKKKKEHFDANYTSLPLGVWGGRLGVMFRDDINDLFEYFEIKQEEYDEDATVGNYSDTTDTEDTEDGHPYFKDIETMDDEMETQKAFMNLHHVYARKCSAAEEEENSNN